jgi:hypothetical protein
MGQVIQVNGDYNIKSKIGATIKLDTGAGVGQTIITGNLVVQGTNLTVSTEQLQIKDNIIILNDGEAGPGVTLRYSGIQIDRGPSNVADDAFLLYDETDGSWNLVNKHGSDPYNFNNTALRLRSILTDTDTDGGDLTLIGTGTGVVNVAGTTAYELQVIAFGDDAIPNKKYVDDAIQGSPARQIRDDNTRIIIADREAIPTGGGLDYLGAVVAETQIQVVVDAIPNTTFFINRAVIQGLEFSDSEIANQDTNTDTYIRTTGTGKLRTNYALKIDQQGSNVATVAGYSQLYAKTPSTGNTGLYFSTTSTTASPNGNRELISTNRALLYSMLF